MQKQTVPAGASEQFGFQSNFGDDFWLADGESWDSGPLPPSDVSGILYWVAESGGADGWQLGNVSCQNELGYPVDAGSIDLLSGETVTCVFTNTRPTCDAGIDIVANCDGIQLDGSAIDPEGDPLSFSWTSDCGASFDDPFQEDPFATLGSSCNASCTFTMTATDGISSCSDSVVVNVDDALPPAFVGPLPGDDTVPCDAVPEAPVLAATDGCGPATVDFQEDASRIGECAGTGILVRTWTASDGCGNSVSHVQNLTIIDAIEPELSGVPDDLVLDCAADLPPADVSASDNCDPDPQVVMEIVSDTRGAECDGAGVVIRRWTATDCSGNSASATQTIVFIDTKAPQLSGVPADLQLECDQALPPANVSASDDCDPDPQVAMEIVSDTRGAVCDGTGVVIRRWTATDCSGNSVSATQTVTFVDTTAPILWGVPLDDTLACDQALPPADVFATDNCDASPRVDLEILSDTRGALCDGAGVVIRRWTATDCSGNSISATQTVTFVDTQAPELAGVPSDLQLECDQPLPPADVSASDNCDPDPDIVMEIVSDTRGAVCDGTGVVVRRWTATDCSGNSISATQTVTFVDTQAPELAGVPADLQLECDQPLPPADVSASDNCDPDPDIVMEIVSDTR
ncbi:MAG TPA: hypothetical protein PK313_10360, partial [Myxococcota bacterium]|nr:hypothetical protein [Myxococcota bacterium]